MKYLSVSATCGSSNLPLPTALVINKLGGAAPIVQIGISTLDFNEQTPCSHFH